MTELECHEFATTASSSPVGACEGYCPVNFPSSQLPVEVIQNLDSPQLLGLAAAAALAIREQSALPYQVAHHDFSDIPDAVVAACDFLEDTELLDLIEAITLELKQRGSNNA